MNPGQWPVSDADNRTTLLAHALSLTALHGPVPWPGGGNPLPDTPDGPREFLNSIVLDGIRTHHFAVTSESPPATALISAVTEAVAAGDPAVTVALHDRLAECRALDVADDLVRELRELDLPAESLRTLARDLTEHGTRRDAVALGIVMLGVAGDARDRDLLLLLGGLEDLTLYCAVALANTQPDRDPALHELAQRVDGWGRIHVVERLKGTQDPAIKAWLLRVGFRNGVLNEYLAHLAATTGGLHDALLAPDVDAELLDGAADILIALACTGGPAADITDYPDALPVIARFGELLAEAPPTLTLISAARSLQRLLTELPSEPEWPAADISRLLHRYSALLERPDWSNHVRSVLNNPAGEFTFNHALSCSAAVGIDAYPLAMERIRQLPLPPYVWSWVAGRAPDPDIADLARLAGRLLPVDEMASGPDPDHPLPGNTDDRILEIVLNRLGPSQLDAARPLIRIALCGRPVRLRRMGMRAVGAVFGEHPPAEILGWVDAAAAVEPNDELRRELTELLERARSTDAS
ncbi:hypothetical protein ACFXPR_27395 [Nocardia tengchongensis]|uniref:hypothetical protein n=1 Tax=Nocardia tengchongensis TaxID=2055889 RepID=UPI0036CCBD02